MPPGEVAVTFDDGPHPSGTPAILDALDELGWPATFFMLGSAVAAAPDVAREVIRRGHVIGVHGFDHRYLIARTPAATWRDLRRATAVVTDTVGVAPQWWRPPYGVLSTAGLAAARSLQLRPLLWSAWGKDWRQDATAGSIVGTLTGGRLDAGTVLLHDSDATSTPKSWRATVAALPLLAEHIATMGLTVAPLPSTPGAAVRR